MGKQLVTVTGQWLADAGAPLCATMGTLAMEVGALFGWPQLWAPGLIVALVALRLGLGGRGGAPQAGVAAVRQEGMRNGDG